jgi:hypothetical protein
MVVFVNHLVNSGADQGIVGAPAAYRAAKVGRDGRATLPAGVPYDGPTTGSYFPRPRFRRQRRGDRRLRHLAPPTL